MHNDRSESMIFKNITTPTIDIFLIRLNMSTCSVL